MPAGDSLKRLGGGRWETRDGRFTIEPQSGTWAVVDSSQANELGLPLVRGPFRSLTAAKDAIESERTSGPAESPLADRIEGARSRARPSKRGGSAGKHAAGKATPQPRRGDEPAANRLPPPPEPKWLRDLTPTDRRRARELIERLDTLAIPDPDGIAHAEIALDRPALTRLAIERAVRTAVAAADGPGDAVRAAVGALLNGRDRELDVRWRLVDEHGRLVDELDLPDPG